MSAQNKWKSSARIHNKTGEKTKTHVANKNNHNPRRDHVGRKMMQIKRRRELEMIPNLDLQATMKKSRCKNLSTALPFYIQIEN